jgi:formate dehydrogenase maturation protein FdhE
MLSRDQERAMKDKDILAIVSTLRSKDQKITDLEAALSDGRVDCTNESTDPPLKRPRMEHEELHTKSFQQSIVRVKEERQAVVTALADVRDDLDIEKDTVTQQEIFLTAWMNKFDELADIA